MLLKNQAPLIFSLRTRSALGAQFIQPRTSFKFISNSFQIYFKLLPIYLQAHIFIFMRCMKVWEYEKYEHMTRMQKNPQTSEDIFWILTYFHGVMWVQSPTCTPARKFHQLASLTPKSYIFK